MSRLVCMVLVLTLAAALVPTPTIAEMRSADCVGEIPVSTWTGAGAASSLAPNVDMGAGALVAPDGRVLWSREATDTRAMASITKLMTAIIVLDRLELDDTLTVPWAALEMGESAAGLRAGQKLSVREALEAALVKSGNEAALSLALRVSTKENAFVKLMNEKAAALGLADTKFANSYGLDEPGHYSSAVDVATLARYAMTRPEVRDIVRKRVAVIGRGPGSTRLESTNVLLGTYRGANGIKTGWTNDAGYSVVASAQRGGQQLVAVVLGCDSERGRFDDAAKLLDWGFSHYRARSVVTSGGVVGRVRVTDYDDTFVPVLASRGATPTVFDLDGPIEASACFDSEIQAPISRDETLGVLTFTQGDRLVASVPLVAGASVEAPGAWERLGITLRRWLSSILD